MTSMLLFQCVLVWTAQFHQAAETEHITDPSHRFHQHSHSHTLCVSWLYTIPVGVEVKCGVQIVCRKKGLD